MARFLRDEVLTNLTIDEGALTEISQVFAARSTTMPERLEQPNAPTENPVLFLTYIIRFDNKGYRIFSLGDLLNYFRQAHDVERVLFTLESSVSLRTNRVTGSFMELRLDQEPSACLLTVTSDGDDWVNSSFGAVKDVLDNHKNWNGWWRTAWTQLLIQLFGVFLGFLISLWAAVKISPSLSIENAFLISFFLVLLIFSNLWVYINQRLLVAVNLIFPNLKFYRPSRRETMHWLLQAVVGGLVLAMTIYILNHLFAYIGSVLGAFIGVGP